jgi:GGDEF domain-containing protein
MSDRFDMHATPRARPVAEAPVDALLALAEELARRWAIALIRARPLERIGEVPLGDLAREAPALCAQAVRALCSDGELERMVGGDGDQDTSPASRLGALAGAPDSSSAVAAVEALRGVLWEALLDELGWSISDRPTARLVADLADRLALVCSMALSATLAQVSVAPLSETDGAAAALVDEERERGDAGHDPDRRPAAIRPAVLVDEQDQALISSFSALSAEDPMETGNPAVADDGWVRQTPGVWGTRPRIEIRDVRGEEGPAAWIGSIGRRLERHEQDGLPFAVLLVELVDIERLQRAEPLEEVSRLSSEVQEALARALRPADSLTRERPGRYWLLTPQTDTAGARTLAEQLVRAVRSSVSHRGAPLEVAVGIAVCPEDGRQASELAAHADVDLYAARAAGRPAVS